jgi:hypothetical protein
MDSAELLAQLADIHLPEPISYWPPAPGWWLLVLLVIILMSWLAVKAWHAHRLRQICAHALHELDTAYHHYLQAESPDRDQQNAARLLFLNEFNAVLRRVSLWHFPNSGVASLGGAAWVDFIREKGESSLLTDEIADALAQGRFMTRCDVNTEQLYRFGESWIGSLYREQRRSATSRELPA